MIRSCGAINMQWDKMTIERTSEVHEGSDTWLFRLVIFVPGRGNLTGWARAAKDSTEAEIGRFLMAAVSWAFAKHDIDKTIADNCAAVAAIPCMAKADGTPIDPGTHPLDKIFMEDVFGTEGTKTLMTPREPRSWRDKSPLL
jgi:hypothetical protein